MTKPQIIAQGAEAIIFLEKNQIIKNRIKKSYRIKEIDEKLRKSRTRGEAKIIGKLKSIIPVPEVIKTDEKQEIVMEFIDGKKLSERLEELDYEEICRLIGENIALMHNASIIHGDLTTSNMIWVENHDLINKTDVSLNQSTPLNKNVEIININTKSARQLSMKRLLSKDIQTSKNEIANSSDKVYFIDFGLAFHSSKIEDKAVDLHLLQQALEAKHFTIWKKCVNAVLKSYEKNAEKAKDILQRIKVIESRGRYKERY